MTDPEAIVRAWCDAISDRDKARFLDLSHAAIAFYGPDGVGTGHDVAAEWFDAEPMRITIKSIEVDGLTVRLYQHIDWLDAQGHVADAADNAAQIEVHDDKVFSYRRIDEAEGPAGDKPVISP
ncbi:hypothetical protein [Pelagibacterium halotolerans]|uniref:hypothetical protein n=1 Tax=Pelagibacterium halotolerans TaxID=531813 RepID=UPI00384E1E8F